MGIKLKLNAVLHQRTLRLRFNLRFPLTRQFWPGPAVLVRRRQRHCLSSVGYTPTILSLLNSNAQFCSKAESNFSRNGSKRTRFSKYNPSAFKFLPVFHPDSILVVVNSECSAWKCTIRDSETSSHNHLPHFHCQALAREVHPLIQSSDWLGCLRPPIGLVLKTVQNSTRPLNSLPIFTRFSRPHAIPLGYCDGISVKPFRTTIQITKLAYPTCQILLMYILNLL